MRERSHVIRTRFVTTQIEGSELDFANFQLLRI